MFVCIYFLQWAWVTPGIGKLAILLKCQAPGQPKRWASTCVQQKLKDLRGINRQFLQAVGLAKGMGEEGHVGKPGFLCSYELDPVGQWWRWGQESQSSASPGSEKIKAESQPHYSFSSFSNDRCFLHMAESAKQAATALPSPGSGLSSRDKHQADDCKTRSIVAVVVRAFHGEHWGAGPVQLWERTRACWEESAGQRAGWEVWNGVWAWGLVGACRVRWELVGGGLVCLWKMGSLCCPSPVASLVLEQQEYQKWGLPGGPVAKTLEFSMQGAQVWSLVRELDTTCHKNSQRSWVPQLRLAEPNK